MKNIFTILFMTISSCLIAQVENTEILVDGDEPIINANYQSASKTITLYTSNFNKCLIDVNTFLSNVRAVITSSNKTETNYSVNFYMSVDRINGLDSLVEKTGYVTQNSYNIKNMGEEIASQKRQINQSNSTIKDLEEDLLQTSLTESEKNNIRSQIRSQKQQVKNASNRLADMIEKNKNNKICTVNLTIKDEITTPGSNSRVNFVNMPGVQQCETVVMNGGKKFAITI